MTIFAVNNSIYRWMLDSKVNRLRYGTKCLFTISNGMIKAFNTGDFPWFLFFLLKNNIKAKHLFYEANCPIFRYLCICTRDLNFYCKTKIIMKFSKSIKVWIYSTIFYGKYKIFHSAYVSINQIKIMYLNWKFRWMRKTE